MSTGRQRANHSLVLSNHKDVYQSDHVFTRKVSLANQQPLPYNLDNILKQQVKLDVNIKGEAKQNVRE